MDSHDALFEDLQAISDDADALGLKDVALVLEFAMDVFLRDTHGQETLDATATVKDSLAPCGKQINPDVEQDIEGGMRLGWSMSNFPLTDLSLKAS